MQMQHRRPSRPVLVIGLVLVAALVLSACSKTSSRGHDSTTQPTTSMPAIAAADVQLGVDVWWVVGPPFTSASGQRTEAASVVRYITSDLHVNAVSISFPVYVANTKSDQVFTTAATPTPANVAVLVRDAEDAHLQVNLRPLLQIGTTNTYIWRGLLRPANVHAFFTSYFEAIRPYLALSQEQHLVRFVYASELTSLSGLVAYRDDWAYLLGLMEGVFKGDLSYDSSGPQYLGANNVMPGYDGTTDAYFPTNEKITASVGQLVSSWTKILDKVPKATLASTVFDEVGIDANSNPYRLPSRVTSGKTNPAYLFVQQRWFTMVCDIVRNFHLKGVYFWNVFFNTDPLVVNGQNPYLPPTVWVDRPGASAIAACFANFPHPS
jgi:hypothetical protein